MDKITIPYGNFGASEKTFAVIARYKNHSLFEDGGLKIATAKGYILLRNRLNEHLPEISETSFKDWVDWALSLDPNMRNLLDGGIDFSGGKPSCIISDCR